MKRPSFQFYPADWTGNIKLRRCTGAARDAWMSILCTLHNSEEYGICRWPLAELAQVAGVSLKLAKELAEKGVLKGAERGRVFYQHTPRHAGKDGTPVVLVDGEGPRWYSSRFVRDEWLRSVRGGSTRFASDNQPDKNTAGSDDVSRSPTARVGERQGDGASTSSPSPSTGKETKKEAVPAFELPADIPAEPFADFVEMRVKVRKPMTDKAKALLVTKLRGLAAEGENITAVLNQSVGNSWTTVYAVKTEGGRINANKPVNASFGSRIGRVIESRAERGFAFEDGGGDSGAPDSLEDQGSPGDGNPQLRLTAQA